MTASCFIRRKTNALIHRQNVTNNHGTAAVNLQNILALESTAIEMAFFKPLLDTPLILPTIRLASYIPAGRAA
jgi:hypothetical protein